MSTSNDLRYKHILSSYNEWKDIAELENLRKKISDIGDNMIYAIHYPLELKYRKQWDDAVSKFLKKYDDIFGYRLVEVK